MVNCKQKKSNLAQRKARTPLHKKLPLSNETNHIWSLFGAY
jgi:hypothetical protein